MIDPTFWNGKRVFITGHTGFKGSWLTQWAINLGATVCGYSLPPPTEPNLFTILGLGNQINHQVGDIRDFEKLNKAIDVFKPEIIFHLAAQPLVRLAYKEPRLTYETNVMGTLNLYEAVRKSPNVRVIVSITTDKCYENKEWVWGYRENDPMGGHDPYSSSKGCAEILSAAYRFSYFNPEQYGNAHQVALATARAGNVIGGGDWALDRLIPDCVRSLSKNESIVLRNPGAVRPWQHVLEPLSGYLLLAQYMYFDGVSFSEGWNFGPNNDSTMTVENVVKNVISSWGSGHYRIAEESTFHEANVLRLDINKAQTQLKWTPRMPITSAIAKSIEIYKLFESSPNKIRDSIIQQIKAFSAD